MGLSVCVVADVPPSHLDLVAGLERAGIGVEKPPDLLTWICGSGNRAVIIIIDGDGAISILQELRAVDHESFVLALLEGADTSPYIRTLQHGATAALPLRAPLCDILATLQSAGSGLAAVPAPVLHALVAGYRSEPSASTMDQCDRQLLLLLAEGCGIALIARRLHLSERTVHRRRRELLRRLGVASTAGAVAWAARRGLLD